MKTIIKEIAVIIFIIIAFDSKSQTNNCPVSLYYDVLESNDYRNAQELIDYNLGLDTVIVGNHEKRYFRFFVFNIMSCSGECTFFEYYPGSQTIKLEGAYSSSPDTMKMVYIFGVSDSLFHEVSEVTYYFHPLRNGNWKYYDTQGKLISSDKYINGARLIYKD